MHPIKAAISKMFKSMRGIQPDTSYTSNPEAKLVEHMTHSLQGMHRYENLIDGTGLHIGMPQQEDYDNMTGKDFPSKPC